MEEVALWVAFPMLILIGAMAVFWAVAEEKRRLQPHGHCLTLTRGCPE